MGVGPVVVSEEVTTMTPLSVPTADAVGPADCTVKVFVPAGCTLKVFVPGVPTLKVLVPAGVGVLSGVAAGLLPTV